MKECNCDLRTKLVGDGCAICNPEQALEYATETIADLTKERDELAAQVEVMRAALKIAAQSTLEVYKAYTDPDWFTGGRDSARRHFFNWNDKHPRPQ